MASHPKPPGGRADPRTFSVIRAVALLTLLFQVVPPGTTVLAGVGHGTHHLSRRAARAHREFQEVQLALKLQSAAESVLHSHGPGSEPHRHSTPVDLALLLTAPSADSEGAEHSAPDHRLDRHLPVAVAVPTATPLRPETPSSIVQGLVPGAPSPPPLPPPKG